MAQYEYARYIYIYIFLADFVAFYSILFLRT